MKYPFPTLDMLSNWVIGFAWLAGLGGFIAAIALMSQGGGGIGLGLAVMVAAFAQAVFITWLAYLGKAVSAMGEGLGGLRSDMWRQTQDRAAHGPRVSAPAAPRVAAPAAPPVRDRVLRWGDAGYFTENASRDSVLASSPN